MSWNYATIPDLTEEQFARWQDIVEQRTGIYLAKHKSILQAGLTRRMREIECDDYEAYYRRITASNDHVEWAALLNSMTVKETSFFRHTEAYDYLRKYLAKQLIKDGCDSVHLWSVGCSTGEEAYSLAIVADECVKASAGKCRYGVTATDISHAALSSARRGYYSARKLELMEARTRNSYFERINDRQYEIAPQLKERVCFAQGNIVELETSPIGGMDVIFCQNVLIYFQRSIQNDVMDQLAERLKPGGLMIVGLGEAAEWRSDKVRRVSDDTIQGYMRI